MVMKKEVQLKYMLEDFLKNHPVKAPVFKVVLELTDYSCAVAYCLN